MNCSKFQLPLTFSVIESYLKSYFFLLENIALILLCIFTMHVHIQKEANYADSQHLNDFNNIKASLPKSGVCPLCSSHFNGLKNHFNNCFAKKQKESNSATAANPQQTQLSSSHQDIPPFNKSQEPSKNRAETKQSKTIKAKSYVTDDQLSIIVPVQKNVPVEKVEKVESKASNNISEVDLATIPKQTVSKPVTKNKLVVSENEENESPIMHKIPKVDPLRPEKNDSKAESTNLQCSIPMTSKSSNSESEIFTEKIKVVNSNNESNEKNVQKKCILTVYENVIEMLKNTSIQGVPVAQYRFDFVNMRLDVKMKEDNNNRAAENALQSIENTMSSKVKNLFICLSCFY